MDNKGQQMRYTEDEVRLLRSTFKDNEKLLKLLRKTFLPEYDPNAPLGQTVDLWMTINIKDLTPEEAYTRLLARNELITHVEQQLFQIKFLAEKVEESEEEKAARQKKDSTK